MTITYNVNRVGNINLSNGILSNFSSSNYATLPSSFNPGNNSWEAVISFTTGNDVFTEQSIFEIGTRGAALCYFWSNNAKLYLSNNGSSWNITTGTNYLELETNTKYILRLKYDPSIGYTISQFKNNFWVRLLTVENASAIAGGTVYIGLNPRSFSYAFQGTFDLNESYIKVYDTLWWEGVTKPPVTVMRFNKVCYLGTTRVSEIIIGAKPEPDPGDWTTTFAWPSASINGTNWFSTDYINIPADKTYESIYKLVCGNNFSLSSSSNIVEHNTDVHILPTLWINGSGNPFIDSYLSGWSDKPISEFTVQAGDTVYLKYSHDASNNHTFSASKDKINWTSITNTGALTTGNNAFYFMRHAGGSYPAPNDCYIDTTESYIKIDGKYLVRPYV